MTYTDLKYLNEEKTMIQATTETGIAVVLEAANPNLVDDFYKATSGDFGTISEEIIEMLAAAAVEPPDPVLEYRKTLECSRLQAKAVLYQLGILDAVNNLVASSDFLVQMAWQEAQNIRRLSPLIDLLKSQVNWVDGNPITDEQLDQLFEQAKTIEF